jgi:hypothetical protein
MGKRLSKDKGIELQFTVSVAYSDLKVKAATKSKVFLEADVEFLA